MGGQVTSFETAPVAKQGINAEGAPVCVDRLCPKDKQKAARVHTLAQSGELGRALSAVTAARLAPKTDDTYNQSHYPLPDLCMS